MTRKDGFFWIKTYSDDWEPAEWYKDGWHTIGEESFHVGDNHFKEIGSEIRRPKE